LKTVIGHESPTDVLTHESDLKAHLLPKPTGVVRVPSLWDPTLAPAGHHVAGIDSSFPATDSIDRATWQLVEASFPEALLDTWRRYCDGDSPTSLAMACDLSARFERRMLMRMGAPQYRTSIPGLYLCGPGVYPGGGVHGACGENAARTIVDDCRGI
jgi:phytoene dehydrogenase-like protein